MASRGHPRRYDRLSDPTEEGVQRLRSAARDRSARGPLRAGIECHAEHAGAGGHRFGLPVRHLRGHGLAGHGRIPDRAADRRLACNPPPDTQADRATGVHVASKPTDRDRYVYHPSRLEVLKACIRVTGTVAAIRKEADGDLHILLALDPAYRSLLRPANQGEELGDLVVEPVCVRSVTQTDAIAICASDPDPFAGAFPAVGEHIWMEGRYVLDLEHGSWAELHPLYRWGPAWGVRAAK